MFPAVRKYDDPMLCADYVRNRPKYPTQIINTILDYIEERVSHVNSYFIFNSHCVIPQELKIYNFFASWI